MMIDINRSFQLILDPQNKPAPDASFAICIAPLEQKGCIRLYYVNKSGLESIKSV